MKKSALFVIVMLAFSWLCAGTVRPGSSDMPAMCTYETSAWNVEQRRSVGSTTVRHAYAALAPEEVDPATGCTVCSEDQELVTMPLLPPFHVCNRIAPKVRGILEDLKRSGAPLFSIVGYHVIRSRGPLDPSGNRTAFSNHSFGTAIDINPGQNGLYDNCVAFGPACRLLHGGERRPGAPGTLEPDSDIVQAFKSAGFQWGGEIAGKQKDFMHFSLTGY